MRPVYLLKGATQPVVGSSEHPSGPVSYQATVKGTGAVGAVVEIWVSDDDSNWMPLGTITLSTAAKTTDGFLAEAGWVYARAELVSISGTGVAVDAIMGMGA